MVYYPNSLLIPSKNFILDLQIQSIKGSNRFPSSVAISVNAGNLKSKFIKVESLIRDVCIEVECE